MRSMVWVGAFGIFAACGFLAQGRDETPKVQWKLEGHPGGVTAIAFSRGDEIATGAGNGIVRIWSFKGEKLTFKLDDFEGISVSGLSFSPDGNVLAASGRGKVGLWSAIDLKIGKSDTGTSPKAPKNELKIDTRVYRWLTFPSTDSEAVYSDLAVTGDGKKVYFTRRNQGFNYPGRVFRYDQARDVTEERPGPKRFDPEAVACISDPESGVAAVYAAAGEKGEPAILLYGFGEPITITRGVPPLTKGTLHKITFATDGGWLAAYSGTLAVWKVPGSHIIHGEPGTLEGVYAAAIGPGNLMATVSAPDEYRDATVNLWKLGLQVKSHGFLGIHWMKQMVDIKKVATYPTTLKDVGCLAFSPNGKILAVGGLTDGVVQLWKIE